MLRALRLRALGDAPDAFASTQELEAGQPDSDWRELAMLSERADTAAVFIAMDRGRGVGMAAARWFDRERGIAQLWGMWVAPEVRRRGLGERLVDEVHGWAASRGALTLRLGVIEDPGGGAAACAAEFYARLGFVTTGETKPLPRDQNRTAFFLARPVSR